MESYIWIAWAFILVAQTFCTTMASRARNSGSLRRHMVAACMSNAVWFLSNGIIVTRLYKILTGEYGWKMAVFTGVYYVTFTLIGAVTAHHICLRTEQGKSAVGANDRYAQITVAEWEEMKRRMAK